MQPDIATAHRLFAIRGSGLIVVMNRREIAESGSHDELIGRKGTYYQLDMAQYAGFAA